MTPDAPTSLAKLNSSVLPRPVAVSAFVGPEARVGRTALVATLGWTLATAGKRVLILDWESDSSDTFGGPAIRVLSYFDHLHSEPAVVGGLTAPTLTALEEVMQLGLKPTKNSGRDFLRRIPAVGSQGWVDVATSRGHRGDRSGFPFEKQPELQALGEQIRSSDYDCVLVDCPPGLAERTMELCQVLCDSAVLCFQPTEKNAELTARHARLLREIDSDYTIVLVPRRAAPDETAVVKFGKRVVRDAFADLPGPPPITVDLPFLSLSNYGAALTTLIIGDDAKARLFDAYGRLASAVTDQAVTAVPEPTAFLRASYRAVVCLEPPTAEERTVVVYAASGRLYAEWITAQLESFGVPAERCGYWDLRHITIPPASVLVVCTEDLGTTTVNTQIDRLSDERGSNPTELRVYGALVTYASDASWLHLQHGYDVIDLFQFTGEVATAPEGSAPAAQDVDPAERSTELLRTAVGGLISPRSRPGPAYPLRSRPETNNVQAAQRNFVGRSEQLEEVRDQLQKDGSDGRVAIWGAPGVGKSQLAIEYAERFATDYLGIWWVPAFSEFAARRSLTDLAVQTHAGQGSDPAVLALDHVKKSDGSLRWLMIYDDVRDTREIEHLLPEPGTAHVLLTVQQVTPPPIGQALQAVPAFPRRESVALLRDRVPGLSPADADTIANQVGDLPLPLSLAAGFLNARAEQVVSRRDESEVQDYLPTVSPREAVSEAVGVFLSRLDEEWPEDDRSSDSTTATILRMLVAAMEASRYGRLARRLLEYLAYVSAAGIALRLLGSRGMLEQLGGSATEKSDAQLLQNDGAEIDRVIWEAARLGLVTVSWGANGSVRMHRILRRLMRDEISEHPEQRRQEVLTALAAFAPTDAEESTTHHDVDLAELERHFEPAGAVRAMAAGQSDVRRWIVVLIRYLFRIGDVRTWEHAIELVTAALGNWPEDLDPHLRRRLYVQLANLYRATGDHPKAREIDRAAQDAERNARRGNLTDPNLRELLASRGHGGDLRGLGDFRAADGHDGATREGLRRALGDDHPHTLMALNNLALSRFLLGEYEWALTLYLESQDRSERILGIDNPRMWLARSHIGACLRELGRLEEAERAGADAYGKLSTLAKRDRDPDDPGVLEVLCGLAATHRRMGRLGMALTNSKDASTRAQRRLGEEDLIALSCRLGYALTLGANKRWDEARHEAAQALAGYRAWNAGHPYTHICEAFVAAYQRACGDRKGGLVRGEQALRRLEETLDRGHPWLLAVAANQAKAQFEFGRPGARQTLLQLRRRAWLYLPINSPTRRMLERVAVGLEIPGFDVRANLGELVMDIDLPAT